MVHIIDSQLDFDLQSHGPGFVWAVAQFELQAHGSDFVWAVPHIELQVYGPDDFQQALQLYLMIYPVAPHPKHYWFNTADQFYQVVAGDQVNFCYPIPCFHQDLCPDTDVADLRHDDNDVFMSVPF